MAKCDHLLSLAGQARPAASGPVSRCIATPTSPRRRWTFWPTSAISFPSSAPSCPASSAARADARGAHQLRRQLLDPAHDPQAGLRSGKPPDREAGPRVDGVLTDHDNIKAPMLLRTVPSARQIPVSVEWSAPYGVQSFHLGIHNLPSAKAAEWMATLAELHRNPSDAALPRFSAPPQRA